MVLLFWQWIRADQREQRRLDRAADRAEAGDEDDHLARYNTFLAATALAARAASKREVTSDQLTRFHSRST